MERKRGRLCHCAVAVVARVGRQGRVVIIILPSVLGSHEYSGHFIKIDSNNAIHSQLYSPILAQADLSLHFSWDSELQLNL